MGTYRNIRVSLGEIGACKMLPTHGPEFQRQLNLSYNTDRVPLGDLSGSKSRVAYLSIPACCSINL